MCRWLRRIVKVYTSVYLNRTNLYDTDTHYRVGWGGVWMAEGESFVDYSDGYSVSILITRNKL